ncbi:MAG: pilus assembly protein N-terminal domain-containing protein [Gallionellaceae bacterium]|nr:pilus assembly protein N-terminal domain-containing protein [Gallionellaceae bacterium]
MTTKRTIHWLALLLAPLLLLTQPVLADSDRSESGKSSSSRSSSRAALQASPATLALTVGDSATVSLSNVSGDVEVSSSSSKVAGASYSSGKIKVTAKAAGSAKLTVRDSRGSVAISLTVTVPPKTAPPAMSASPGALSLAPGGEANIALSNVSGSLSASSSNTRVAIVEASDARVKVTAKSTGSAQVTIKDGKTTLTIPVTVTQTTSGGGSTGGGTTASTYTLVAWNDLGMHCMDGDYSVFSILPPFNNLHAQLVDSGNNKLVTAGVTLTYEAMADLDGSTNSISSTKSNFWLYAQPLYGAKLPDDVGLTGNMAPSYTPRALTFEAASGQYIADGIPLTPYDDAGRKNFYPMVKVVARDAAGKQLAQARVVLPVSDEMSCAACHASNSGAAAKPAVGWANDAQTERDYKRNILALHDEKSLSVKAYQDALKAKGYAAAGLAATAASGKPILCAACHASNALPGTGVAGIKPLTAAIHSHHAMVKDAATGQVLDSINNRSACYQCHPGSQTKCLRGAMGKAVLANGQAAMDCQSCHGTMSNVGSATRTGWLDQPNCQACHHDGKRDLAAVSGTGILKKWQDTRYATNANVPGSGFSLYRFSKGHGGLQCESCHGSTHAVYPSSHANDNVLSNDVQGRSGTIGECASCHKKVPMTADKGPHGMHTMGSAWVSGHKNYAENNTAACAYCHGADYRGSVLSTVKAARSFNADGKTVNFAAGQKVGCYDCHNGPKGD